MYTCTYIYIYNITHSPLHELLSIRQVFKAKVVSQISTLKIIPASPHNPPTQCAAVPFTKLRPKHCGQRVVLHLIW